MSRAGANSSFVLTRRQSAWGLVLVGIALCFVFLPAGIGGMVLAVVLMFGGEGKGTSTCPNCKTLLTLAGPSIECPKCAHPLEVRDGRLHDMAPTPSGPAVESGPAPPAASDPSPDGPLPGSPLRRGRGRLAWGYAMGVVDILGGLVLCVFFLPLGLAGIGLGLYEFHSAAKKAVTADCPRCEAGLEIGAASAVTCPDCKTRLLVRDERVLPAA